jgi:hypothetical protein
MIFFHDKHWYRSEPLFSVEEEQEQDEDDEDEELDESDSEGAMGTEPGSSPSQVTVTSASSTRAKKTEYEFLLFNYLLRFVHREGQIGDFARAGLLFLMDVAMSPGEPTSKLGDSPSARRHPDPVADAAVALAEYIVDGDFSEVLGAGLGAVYSLLPSKLKICFRNNSEATSGSGMVIGGSYLETDEEKGAQEALSEKERALGIEDASSPVFKSRLEHFLKMLEFIQDILRRNVIRDVGPDSVGTAIVQSILDAVRQIFLENVLYPSILECSDSDGSGVAVMSYIEVVIRSLEDGPLSALFLSFLMSEDNDALPRPRLRPRSTLVLADFSSLDNTASSPTTEKQNRLRRRKSSAMMLLEMEAVNSNKQSGYVTSNGRFTLKDLILSNLRSNSQPTATAALQLFHSMLVRHAQLTVERLLVVIPDANATSFPTPALRSDVNPPATLGFDKDHDAEEDEPFLYPGAEVETGSKDCTSSLYDLDASLFMQPQTTYYTHEREMGLYLTLISRVDPTHDEDAFSTGYDRYLQDALLALQAQLNLPPSDDAESRSSTKHHLNVNDPIISLILEALRRFFSNTPEFNVALTGVLATLSLNPNRSLAGFLTFGCNDTPEIKNVADNAPNIDNDGDDRSVDFRIEENLALDSNPLPASSVDEQSRPLVHSIFHALVGQLERYRQLVDDFDRYLLERRRGLLFNENLTDALTLALDISEDVPPQKSNPSRLKAPTSVQKPQPEAKAKPTPASFFSLLTPKRSKFTASTVTKPSPDDSSIADNTLKKNVAASPFGPHYQRTAAISVEPFIAPVPLSGPWTPATDPKWNSDEEDMFWSSGHWGENTSKEQYSQKKDDDERGRTITLSRLLDSVVILEESIKELVAIIQARRTLGVDSIRYL